MSDEMSGRTCLVVGAGPGIGKACALRFAEKSADLVLIARNAERLNALVDEIASESAGKIHGVVADISQPGEAKRSVEETIALTGRVDAVVSVATRSGSAKLLDGPWEHMREAFEMNVIATLEISRTAAQWMIDNEVGGSIVHTSTLGAHILPPGMAPYTATKAAMVSATRTMAKEFGAAGIRVNIVTPGYVNGPRLEGLWGREAEKTGETSEEVSKRYARTAALKRHVDPEDIANSAYFLCSDQARNLTGLEIIVDAGQNL